MTDLPADSARADGPAPVTVQVPAKINLALLVGPARPDGFHELATVFHSVSLTDTLTAHPVAGAEITLDVAGISADQLGAEADNLAVRAARMLSHRHGQGRGAHLHLTKGIPVAGGMAGGSADAAAALWACARLWGLDLGTEDLVELGAELGSDVPFTVLSGTAIGAGRGEHLTPLSLPGTLEWVLVTSTHGLSTPQVFAQFDQMHPPGSVGEPSVPREVVEALATGDPQQLAPTLRNDLAAAALHLRPDLAEVLTAGEQAGALRGIVSGSGPTCVFLAPDAARADRIADTLRTRFAAPPLDRDAGSGPRVAQVLRASGPAQVRISHG